MTANPPAATPCRVSQRLQRRNLGLALQSKTAVLPDGRTPAVAIMTKL